jgi:hypothetical protein
MMGIHDLNHPPIMSQRLRHVWAVDPYPSLQFAQLFSFSTIKKISMHGFREEAVFYTKNETICGFSVNEYIL